MCVTHSVCASLLCATSSASDWEHDSSKPSWEMPSDPCRLDQDCLESEFAFSLNELDNIPLFLQHELSPPSLTQAQLDDGAEAQRGHEGLYDVLLGYPMYEVGSSTYGNQATIELQIPTAGLSSTSNNERSPSRQYSDTPFPDFGLTLTDTAFGIRPQISIPQVNTNNSFSLGQSPAAYELFSESSMISLAVNEQYSMLSIPVGRILTSPMTGEQISAPVNKISEEAEFSHLGLRCLHPGCVSKAVFLRQCDLNSHYRLHFRNTAVGPPIVILITGGRQFLHQRRTDIGMSQRTSRVCLALTAGGFLVDETI